MGMTTRMTKAAGVDNYAGDWSLAERVGVRRGFTRYGYEEMVAGMRRNEPARLRPVVDIRGGSLLVDEYTMAALRRDYAFMIEQLAVEAGVPKGRLSVLPCHVETVKVCRWRILAADGMTTLLRAGMAFADPAAAL